jgi:hypothetical protein
MNSGIDYGLGQSNVDKATGVHYGVISQHSIMPESLDYMDRDYGEPTCPECGNPVIDSTDDSIPFEGNEYETHGCNEYACIPCESFWDSSDVFSEESLGFSYDQDGYKLCNCLDSDVFVILSPYYTFAKFCSPCIPGAGDLNNYTPDGIKTYCLGHDFFEDNRAPYPVYSVETGLPVFLESENQ